MKTRRHLIIGLITVSVALLLFDYRGAKWSHSVQTAVGSTSAAPELAAISESSVLVPAHAKAHSTAANTFWEDSSQANERREMRGSGYIWGNALKGVYANGIRNAEGKWHLNLTEIERSFKSFQRPVNLEDASAAPEKRAEYLAAVITAALDLSGAEQPRFAKVLQQYYARDQDLGELGQAEQKTERFQLSTEARQELLEILPIDARSRLDEIFSAPDFLFRSMSVAAEEITLEKSNGTMVARSGALLNIAPNGETHIQSGSASFQQKRNR